MASTSKQGPRLAVALVLIVAWTAILLFAWALRPIGDTVPVSIDPTSDVATRGDVPESQFVECNTMFASNARDTAQPLPAIETGYVYSRTPCEGPHADARWAFGINVALIVAMLVGWYVTFTRSDEAGDPVVPSQPLVTSA